MPMMGYNNQLETSSQCKSGGIHAIAVNPDQTLLATGAHNQNQIAVYKLPTFEPYTLLEGHSDLIFGLEWVSNDRLLSCSRDHTVQLWHIVPGKEKISPLVKKKEHFDKVRDIKYNAFVNQAMTVSTDTTLKVWDVEKMEVVKSIQQLYTNETVCLSLDPLHRLYSVGSQNHVSLIDSNSKNPIIHSFPSLDAGLGVRSMTWRHHLLVVGGGMGRIGFYDLRQQKYLQLQEPDLDSSFFNNQYHASGQGWLIKDESFNLHFNGITIPNAIYSLNYDPSGTRLLAAGGPLQLGLKGGYAAIWE